VIKTGIVNYNQFVVHGNESQILMDEGDCADYFHEVKIKMHFLRSYALFKGEISTNAFAFSAKQEKSVQSPSSF